MEPLRIGVSGRLLYPDSTRSFLPAKSVQYLEQSVANWLMSGEVLAFMIPALSLAAPHLPRTLKAKHYVDALDGLLLQGGADMSPKSYGETPLNPLWTGDEVRDQYEIELFHEFVTQGKPVFGICRGHQVINVALGGTLYQDIGADKPGSLKHDCFPTEGYRRDYLAHDVALGDGSRLRAAFARPTIAVNSMHHQGIKDLAPPLLASGVAPDGLVEGIESRNRHFLVGVQWHPEVYESTDPPTRRLFQSFIEAARSRRA